MHVYVQLFVVNLHVPVLDLVQLASLVCSWRRGGRDVLQRTCSCETHRVLRLDVVPSHWLWSDAPPDPAQLQPEAPVRKTRECPTCISDSGLCYQVFPLVFREEQKVS